MSLPLLYALWLRYHSLSSLHWIDYNGQRYEYDNPSKGGAVANRIYLSTDVPDCEE